MAITKEKKAEILQELIDKFGKSKTVVFSDYRGLDVSSISDLRGKLRESGSECKVAKKTLIKLAAKDQNLGELDASVMEGPVAVTFSYEDELSGLKVLFNFSKDNENLKLLGGIVDGKVVGAEEIIQLAKLPSKEELYAKLLGSLNAPISGVVGIMGNLIGGFVRVVSAYKDTLPEEGSAPAESAEETKEEAPDNTAEASGDAVGEADMPSTADDGEAPKEQTEEKPAENAEESAEPAADTPAESTEETPEATEEEKKHAPDADQGEEE